MSREWTTTMPVPRFSMLLTKVRNTEEQLIRMLLSSFLPRCYVALEGWHGRIYRASVDQAITELVCDTSNSGFSAWVFHVLNGNQTRVLSVTYFCQQHIKPLCQYCGVTYFCKYHRKPLCQYRGIVIVFFYAVDRLIEHFMLIKPSSIK